MTTNTCYNEKNILLADALYSGGDKFDAIKGDILYYRAADDQPAYKRSRMQCAEYFDYIAGLFDGFISTMFQNSPKIVFSLTEDTPDKLTKQVNDHSQTLKPEERQAYETSKLAEINRLNDDRENLVNQKLTYYNSLNCGLIDLLQGRALDIMEYGYGLLTASYPEKPLPENASHGYQIENGHLDACFCYLPIPTVVDWEMDAWGCLKWIKTQHIADHRSEDFGPADEDTYTWTYYTPTDKIIYTATKKKNEKWDEKSLATLVSITPNSFGLPIFECSVFNRACLMDRAKRPVISLFNREASEDFALNAQCYAQPWAATDRKMNEIAGNANEFALWLFEKGATCGYMVPEGVVFDALRTNAEKKQQNLLAAINAEAIRMDNRDQHASSGVKVALEKSAVESMLSFYACTIKHMLCCGIDYIIKSRRDEGIVQYKVLGLDNFSPVALDQKLKNSAQFFSLPVSPTAKKLHARNIAQDMVPNATTEEREIIDQETQDINYSPTQVYPIPGNGEQLNHPDSDEATSDADSSNSSQNSSNSSNSSQNSSKGSTAAPIEGKEEIPGDTALIVKPKLGRVPTAKIINWHDVDDSDVKPIKAKIKKEGYSTDPEDAILVTQYDDGRAIAHDGHHRLGGAKELGMKSIPAWIIKESDIRPLLDARFKGKFPDKISELDPFIQMPNGKSYSEQRDPNDHKNGSSKDSQTSSKGSTATSK